MGASLRTPPSLCASTARCGLSHRTRLSCSTTATCVSALVSCGTMEPPSMSMGAPCPFQPLRPSRDLRGRVGAPARGALVGDVLKKIKKKKGPKKKKKKKKKKS